MTNQPLFSVLTANYNNGHFFEDCYHSIISQTYKNWECIIVDDCSTDNSLQQIKNLVGQDSRFKIYRNEHNSGVGFTKKRCIDLAHGEICGFVDPDDTIIENAIEIMVKEHIIHFEASMIYSNYIFHDEKMNFKKIQKNQQIENNNPYFFNLDFVINHFATFKREIYNRTAGIDPYMKRAIDMDLYFKLYEKGQLIYIDYNLYNYRVHRGGVSTFDNSDKAFYWHWYAINSAAKRRNINVENLFNEFFIKRQVYKNEEYKISLLKKSRWIKLGQKIGFLKWF